MRDERGQVLPLFALMLIALFGIAALAIDVSNAYAARQAYRTAADAAALAGAQDIQSRTVTSSDQRQARRDALDLLKEQLGATGDPTASGCTDTNFNLSGCPLPGTPYLISVKTPSPSCSAMCQPMNALQVTVDHPTFAVSFAHLLGVNSWNVGVTSVAGLEFPASYALVTLQPPDINNHGTLDQNIDKDIVVAGTNTVLSIGQGDIGTNTSAHTTNSGVIQLADGFYIDHIDDLSNLTPTPNWSQPDGVHPMGRYIGPLPLIQDPDYYYARFDTAPSWSTQSAAQVQCAGQAGFPTDPATVAFLTKNGTVTPSCYQPGIYADNQAFSVGPGAVAYLLPGAYYFTHGLTQNGTLAGGMISNQPGVVLRFPRLEKLTPNSAVDFALNTGATTCDSQPDPATCRSSAAMDFASPTPQPVETSDGLILTIEVDRDPACFAGTDPRLCGNDVNQNTAVSLGGSGQLRVAGVIYGPSDNMTINASAQTGTIGQIISYSVKYAGHATLNQNYPGPFKAGVLRLDSACTAPGTPCNP